MIEKLVRSNIKNMEPYSSSKDELDGTARIHLDANENPFDMKYSRYPDPYQSELKSALGMKLNIAPDRIFVGNGSDEIIDLLIKLFCEPGKDKILIFQPTYGVYRAFAATNNVEVMEIMLDEDFQPPVSQIINSQFINSPTINSDTKLMFLCSPNNPTGNLINEEIIVEILENYDGIVVIDEAYIDFAESRSAIELIEKFDKLIILRTFSKAYGLAGLRIGYCLGDKELVRWLNKIKMPYNVNSYSQTEAIKALSNSEIVESGIRKLIELRNYLSGELSKLKIVGKVFRSDANFLMVRFDNSDRVYNHLLSGGIVVRNVAGKPHCDNCLRITIGTEWEMNELLKALNKMKKIIQSEEL